MMYPQRKQKLQSRSQAMVATRDGRSLILGSFAVAALAIAASGKSHADSSGSFGGISAQKHQNFYQQLLNSDDSRQKASNFTVLSQVAGNHFLLEQNQPFLVTDSNFAFNYLWMQQHQPNYKFRSGGAAAGKIVRMGVRALYKIYYGSNSYSSMSNRDNDADVSGAFSNMNYRLRLSSDNVRFGIKYEF